MEAFVKRLIKEHVELKVKIDKLEEFIYGNGGLNVITDIKHNKTQDDLFRNMTEYANLCMQLADMRHYLKTIECRLNNNYIYVEDGKYFEKIGEIVDCECTKECKEKEDE